MYSISSSSMSIIGCLQIATPFRQMINYRLHSIPTREEPRRPDLGGLRVSGNDLAQMMLGDAICDILADRCKLDSLTRCTIRNPGMHMAE